MTAFDYDRARLDLARHQTATWPLSALKALVDGHQAGTPFRAIAKEMGRTPSAAIGKAYRLGLPIRMTAPQVSEQRARINRYRKPVFPKARTSVTAVKSVKQAAADAPAPPKLSSCDARHTARSTVAAALKLEGMIHGPISDLAPTQCRWPVGDPKDDDFAFCGRLKGEGPYCPAHARASVNAERTSRARREDRRLGRTVVKGAA